jgi:NADH dehydrogenase
MSDPAERRVRTRNGAFAYDYLILAARSRHSYFGHPEWETFAPALKYVADATAVRYGILKAFETAETEQHPEPAAYRRAQGP